MKSLYIKLNLNGSISVKEVDSLFLNENNACEVSIDYSNVVREGWSIAVDLQPQYEKATEINAGTPGFISDENNVFMFHLSENYTKRSELRIQPKQVKSNGTEMDKIKYDVYTKKFKQSINATEDEETVNQSIADQILASEQVRDSNENVRNHNEGTRINSENSRIEAEELRVNNELLRQENEEARKVFESYNNSKQYVIGNKVSYNGSSYVCYITPPSINILPTNEAYWLLSAQKGSDGYTPVKGTDYFDGDDGLSAYQVWLAAGNVGTEAQFLAKLKGNQWKGAYIPGTPYVVDDVVSYNGSSYICVLDSLGNLPSNTTYWSLFAQAGEVTNTQLNERLQNIANGTGIIDKAITPEKTSFMALGKNLINPSEFLNGYYVNQLNGVIAQYTGLFCTGFIEVLGGESYYYQNTVNGASDFRRAWYDENKVFISGTTGAFSLLVAPANAKYLRFSTKTDYINAIHQLALGDSASSIEEYGYNIEDVYISSNFIVDKNDVMINLPTIIPAIVGQQIDIYFANITNVNLKDYDVDVVCATGKQMDDGFHIAIWTAGTYPITISIYKEGKLKASSSSNIVVKPTSIGNGVNKKVLYIGDSTIAQNTLTQGLLDKFNADVMDITLIGTKGTAPNKHEGVSGWTLGNFRLTGSAFFNGTDFDIGYYLTQNSFSAPDYVIIQLGINDVFSMTDDISLESTLTFVLNHYNYVVNNIKSYNSSIKIGICLTIPPNSNQDAFGNAYNCGQTRWRYLINNKTFVNRLLNLFKGRESENIYLIPNNAFINTVSNISDAVHPNSNGYLQLSNLAYAWLKSFEV